MTDTTELASTSNHFRADLSNLSASALRQRYPAEANCHSNLKRRVKSGHCELDPAWDNFRAFLKDMGPRPDRGFTIDRIDNAIRRYGPGLCRWATKAEQTRNRSNTKWIEFQGERITAGEFAEKLSMPYSTLHSALARGETPENIARRASAPHTEAGLYMPSSADTPNKLAAFEASYKEWLKGIKRADRRKLASREAFAVVRAATVFKAAQFVRDRQIELTPSDVASFENRYSQELRILNNALRWAQEAARALYRTGDNFSTRLYPSNEMELLQLAELYDWFRQPPDNRPPWSE